MENYQSQQEYRMCPRVVKNQIASMMTSYKEEGDTTWSDEAIPEVIDSVILS